MMRPSTGTTVAVTTTAIKTPASKFGIMRPATSKG